MPETDTFNLQGFLPYLLTQAAEESSLAFQQVYKDRYGMLRTEWRVLFHLGIYGRMTATEIGTRAKTHKTKVSRAVHKLAQRRFLHRFRSEEDRRVEWLELTQTGEAAYRDLRQIAQEYDASLRAQFEDHEVELLKTMLKNLAPSSPATQE